MDSRLCALIVGGREADALLIEQVLRRGGYEPSFERVGASEALNAALAREAWDVVIVDDALPRLGGLEALAALRENGCELPVIVLSTTDDKEAVVKAVKAGADDYVSKDRMDRLAHAVRRALGRTAAGRVRRHKETTLQKSALQYRITLDAMADAIHVVDRDLRIVLINTVFRQWLEGLGLAPDVVGQNIFEAFAFLPDWVQEEYRYVFDTGEILVTEETSLVGDGEITTETRKVPIIKAGGVDQVITIIRDITQRKQAEEALRESEAQNRALLSAIPDLIFQLDRDGVYLDVVPARDLKTVSPAGEMLGKKVGDVLPPEIARQRMDCIAWALQTGEPQVHEYQLVHGDDRVDYEARVVPSGEDKVLVLVRDITERRQTEKEKGLFLERIQHQHATLVRLITDPALAEGHLKEALEAIAKAAAETLDVERVNIWLLTYDRRKLDCLEGYERSSRTHTAGRALKVEQYPNYFAALEAGRIVDAADVRMDPRTSELTSECWEPLGIGASLSAPIRLYGQVVGLICHDYVGPARTWLPDEITFASQLADLVAQALLSANLRRRTEELAVITRVSREITSTPDLQQVLNSIARRAAELSQSDASGVFAFRPDGRLYLAATYGLEDTFIQAVNVQGVRLGQGGIGQAAAQRRPIQIPDVLAQPDYPFARRMARQNLHSVLAVPMLQGQEVVGGIVLLQKRPRHYDPPEIAFVQALAQQCVNAVETARLLEAEARRRREAETLRAATQALSSTLDLQRVFELILSELQQVVPYDSATVQQLKGGRLEIIGGRGFPNLEELLGVGFDLTANDNPNQEVVRTREPLILEDAPAIYKAFRREPHAQAGIRSWLGVPLLFGDRVTGMVTVDKKEPGFYTEEHARLVLAFAAQAAIAIENARLLEAEARRRREAETLRAATQALSSTLDLQRVFELILSELQQVVPYDSATVQQRKGEWLEIIGGRGFPNLEELLGVGFDLTVNDNPNREVVRTREPLILEDAPAVYKEFRREPHAQAGIRSWLGVPLLFGDRVIGMVAVDKKEPGFYTNEHARLVLAFAAQAAIAIENAQLFAEEEKRSALLAQALEQQQELAWLKSEFIQNVSHELRTPLAIARGYAELLDDGALGKLQPEQQEPVAIIARRMRMLTKLVDDLSAILAAEDQELHREPVDLAPLARNLLADFQTATDEAGLALASEVSPDLPPVLGDSLQLYRVLDNLLGNALKFTPEGGSITLCLRQEGANLVLEVTDTGIGIPSDQLENIFERFYQVDGSMSRRYGGAGLGLALVKEIVQVHGGRVSVESELGQGSTFRVCLPVAKV